MSAYSSISNDCLKIITVSFKVKFDAVNIAIISSKKKGHSLNDIGQSKVTKLGEETVRRKSHIDRHRTKPLASTG
jgi:hypothetical protein